MENLIENQLDATTFEAVESKLEKIALQAEIKGFEAKISFLEKKLVEKEILLAETELSLDKARKSKDGIFQVYNLQLESIRNLKKRNYQLKKKLAQTERVIADASKLVEDLVLESFPPCEQKTFQKLQVLFDKKETSEH